MKTLKELSRMIAWLVVAGFLFFSGLYFYDAVREYRQEKFSFDRQITELQAQNKVLDAKIESLKQSSPIEILKRQNKCEQDIIILFVITCILYLLIGFGGVVVYRITQSRK